jgi:hypothetical protein
MRAFLVVMSVAAFLGLATPVTRAQEEEQPAEQEEAAAFPKGTQFFSLSAAYQNERTGADIHLAMVTAGFGHYFLDNAAFELQLVGYQAHDEEDALGLGGNALARYHFLNFGAVSIYGDVLAGVFGTTNDFPTGGTCLNFTYAGGPGMDVRLQEGLYLDFGIRFQHVSNAFIEGRDRNPIFNSFGGYVGLMWTH